MEAGGNSPASNALQVLTSTILSRRMTRDFQDEPIPSGMLSEMLELARRAPSAGNSQGAEFVVLEGERLVELWDLTLPEKRREGFAWPGLLRAPVAVVPVADAGRYLARYSEADKSATCLGGDTSSWDVPYWYVDCAFATQNLLLLAEARGIGALFFGFFERTQAVREFLELPEGAHPLGCVALGWRGSDDRPSQSAKRSRRPLAEVVHWNRWGNRQQG